MRTKNNGDGEKRRLRKQKIVEHDFESYADEVDSKYKNYLFIDWGKEWIPWMKNIN